VIERARVITALLHDGADRDVHRLLLQTLLPGVVSVCRSLHFGRGVVSEPGEFMTEAVTTLSELLSEWAGQSRTYAAPDILSALRGRLRRWILKEKQLRASGESAPERAVTDTTSLEARLATFAHGEYADLARAVFDRVIGGLSVSEVAQQRGVSARQLRSDMEEFVTKHVL
jgi:hypothetical protein